MLFAVRDFSCDDTTQVYLKDSSSTVKATCMNDAVNGWITLPPNRSLVIHHKLLKVVQGKKPPGVAVTGLDVEHVGNHQLPIQDRRGARYRSDLAS